MLFWPPLFPTKQNIHCPSQNLDMRLKTLLSPAMSTTNLKDILTFSVSRCLQVPSSLTTFSSVITRFAGTVQNQTTTKKPCMIHLYRIYWLWLCQVFLIITAIHQIAPQSKMYLLTWAASLAGNKHICPHSVTLWRAAIEIFLLTTTLSASFLFSYKR